MLLSNFGQIPWFLAKTSVKPRIPGEFSAYTVHCTTAALVPVNVPPHVQFMYGVSDKI